MSNVERNWLIRTSQNQILGPVAKSKVVEFIQKGALGLTDEVTSGNGYWFHLREKDLVDKYLLGDVPQSYNPISEAKSTLKLKANPDKTTSINASPANATQVINLKNYDLGAIPKNDDLEYPDITVVHKMGTPQKNNSDVAKVPTNDDLEFPDITLVQKMASQPSHPVTSSVGHKEVPKVETKRTLHEEEKIILPKNDDLEYPDMDFIKETVKEVEVKPAQKVDLNFEEEEVTFEVPNLPKEKTDSKISIKREKTAPDLRLDFKKNNQEEVVVEKMTKNENRPQAKMLHERKTRGSQAANDNGNDKPKVEREIAADLKNRNDSYLFIILIVLIILIVAVVFYYYRYILNKPIPV
jgi:hypothetical protein